MKARSVVFTRIQNPETIFGLPPKMVIGTVCIATLLMIVLFAIAIFVAQWVMAIAMIAFALTAVTGLAFTYRAGRADRHVESVFLTSAKFWRGSPRRWLLAGSAPVSPRGGRS